MNIKTIIKYCLLLLFVNRLLGQTVNGKVLDAISSDPLGYVNIYLPESSFGTITNSEGDFELPIPENFINNKLIFSVLGYESQAVDLNKVTDSLIVRLKPSPVVLNEVIITNTSRLDANQLILEALENHSLNCCKDPYLQKGFVRYYERNTKVYKWLIEAAITLFQEEKDTPLKINVEEIRKSFDFRSVDSLHIYKMNLKNYVGTENTPSFRRLDKNLDYYLTKWPLKEVVAWHELKANSLDVTLKGQMHLLNQKIPHAIFNRRTVLETHNFFMDSILKEGERYIYKIKITPSKKMVDLNTKHTYNNGYLPVGYIYIYEDNRNIKEINYALLPGSKGQKARSEVIYGSTVSHRIVMRFSEFEGNVYLKYYSYETPKSINLNFKPTKKGKYNKNSVFDEEDWYYSSKQEVLFTELITNKQTIDSTVRGKTLWDSNIFEQRHYNKPFWENYNILLETEEQKKLIRDLEEKVSLKEQFNQN